MPQINEKLFIELYNTGKSDIELAKLFDIAERTIQRYGARLRSQGKIQLRKNLNISGHREKTKFKPDEIFEEVQVYFDNAKQIYTKNNEFFNDIRLEVKWNKKKQNEDMALIWSDMHTGMINHHPLNNEITYNDNIQQEEVLSLMRGISRFGNLYKPSYNIETFRIFDVGDNITNDRIYEGQKTEIICGVGEQILKCFEIQSYVIRELLRMFPRVVMYKMVGNHGRTTSKPIGEPVTNNFEFLLGKMLQERFKNNKRVEIIVPEQYRYTVTIRGHKYLISHGDTIRGATLNSIEKAVKDLSTLAYKEFYDVMIIGHFHSALKLRITPETTLLVNGCWIDMDDYAYTKLRKFSTATQCLFNISHKSAVHNLQEINLKW